MKWAFYERLQAAIAAGGSTAVVTRLSDGAQALFDGTRWDGALALDDDQRAGVQRMLIGDRSALGQPTRTGERIGAALSAPLKWLLPDSVRPIEARTVALGLMRAVHTCDRPGVFTLPSHELLVVGAES